MFILCFQSIKKNFFERFKTKLKNIDVPVGLVLK